MNPRERLTLPEGSIRSALARRHRALRNAIALHFAVRAGAAGAAAVAIAVLAGLAFSSGEAAAWTRLVLLLGAVAAGAAWAVRRTLAAAPGFDRYLERAEERFPDLRSWLRNAVDFAAAPGAGAGTSPELAAAVTRETVRRLEGLPLEALAPRLGAGRPAAVIGGALLALALGAAFAPRALERSWTTLWRPSQAAPLVTLTVEPGSVRVTPGASLTVFARVRGTSHAPRLMRSADRSPAAIADGRAAGDRLWRFDLTQLTRDQDYQVRVASATSPRYHIALAGEPIPVSFEIEYQAPAYAHLPAQRGAALRGDLSALRGTRARVEVTFDRDLERLEVQAPGAALRSWTAVNARRWRGELPIEKDGDYELHAVAHAGEGRYRYRIQPLADAPPVLAVRTPQGDVDLPNGQIVALEVLGQDDLGLSELELQFKKSADAPWRDLPLARFGDHPREADVRARWDASPLGLLPGQTATFKLVLFDDNAVSGRGRAESPAFELRFPSLGELYDQIDQTQGTVQKSLEKVAQQANELQKSLDELSRQPPPGASQTPNFERHEELKSSLERQQELSRQLDQAAQELKHSVDRAEERRAYGDEMQRKLQELTELMQQIQSPEFKQALDRMRQAMENLDSKLLENQLPDWKQHNREMMQNLERTIDLLKKMREEEKLDALAKRAEELKAEQDQLNQEHAGNEAQESQPSPSESKSARNAAQRQEQAAQKSEQLAKDLNQGAQSPEAQGEQQRQLDQIAQELQQQAAGPQHEAAQAAGSHQSGKARRSGQRASQALDNAAKRLAEMASQMQQQQEGVDLAAVRRAAQDLVSLQRASQDNLDPGVPNEQRADQQTDLSDGVARVADSLGVLAKQTPFISQQLSQALGRAMGNLSQSGKDLAAGNRARGDQLGRDAGTALNQAVLELRQSESSMCNKPGQGKSGQQPGIGPRMDQLGQQQSQLNQRSHSLAQRLSQQLRLSAGDQQEVQRMAQEQQRLREQLEQIQRDDEARQKLLGRLDAVHQDMQDVEEQLRAGNTGGDLEEKQNRILSRLLDAQRSVNRRDFDPQRESRPGVDVARGSAAEIPADLLRENDRLRLDLLKADADRYPAQYRAFVEAYLRSLNGTQR